jgi:hypothetical protein
VASCVADASISDKVALRAANAAVARKEEERGRGSSMTSSPLMRPGREDMTSTRDDKNTAS